MGEKHGKGGGGATNLRIRTPLTLPSLPHSVDEVQFAFRGVEKGEGEGHVCGLGEVKRE